MGISGLLPLLKSIQKPCNLKKFAGQTIGVDAYGWLHRGTVACATELALGRPTRKHIDYSMHRVRMLLHFGVTPYIVFDGDYLPSKAKTEAERARRREESKQRGLELYRLNKPSQAHLELQKAVDITPEMARQFIDELKKIGVQYVVAPYEADAQMVYLEKKGIIQGVLSEDSDLLVFGAKRLLTKLDQYGDCIEINRSDFTSCREISLIGWTDAEFRRMAILSGCDYLASINKMGLKTAYRLVRKHKKIEKIIRLLQFDGQYHVPTGYLDAFRRAELTFLHQLVFCPIANDVVMMTEIEQDPEVQDLSFIGDRVDRKIAIGVAKGDLDPMTKAPIRVHSSYVETPLRTPWTKPRRSVGEEDSTIMKENKSIKSFFSSKRTPLAELDVNVFTPSPTQAQILRQNEGAQWDASPATTGTSSLENATPESETLRPRLLNAQSTPLDNSLDCGLAKKRKLMNEGEAFQKIEDLQGTSSKFFTTPKPEKTRLGGRTKSRKKATDFTIWSDDSIENTMIELAGEMTSPGSSSERKGDIQTPNCTSSKEKPHQKSQVCKESQSTHASGDITTPGMPVITGAESSILLAPPPDGPVDDNISSKPAEHSDSGSDSSERPSRDLTKSEPRTQSDFVPRSNSPRPVLSKQKSLTGLQRLGIGALSRSKSYSVLSSIAPTRFENFDTLLLRPSSPKQHEPGQRRPPSMPMAFSFGPDASIAKGSEDTMIPNSEDEGSDVLSEEERIPAKPSIDLGRFAFTG